VADNYKILAQDTAASIEENSGANQANILYTVPENTQASVSSVSLINTAEENVEYSLGVVKAEDVDGSAEEYPEFFQQVNDAPFVAVVTDGSTNSAYSTDGITWTQTTLPTSASWTSVTYGDGKFVAVAFYNTAAAYSTDGITWTQTTLPTSAGWTSVTYGDGKFVAVATFYTTTAAYSTDGITWTQTTLPTSASWQSVTYGDGKFVAVAYYIAAAAAYSTDGITWTQTTLPTSAPWRSVTYGDGKFVAVARDTTAAAHSTDGITWTQSTMPTSASWQSVTYGDGKFVAVAFNSDTAAYSTDGITWTQSTMPTSDSWQSVTHGQTTQLTETLNIIGGQGTTQTEEFLPVTFYTVPEGKQTTVTSVFVANHNDNAATYDFAVVPAGEELSLKHHLRWDMEIAAKDFENISTKITMSAGDSLVIFPSTVDTVSVTAFGVEK
jgi:hypothetical protein